MKPFQTLLFLAVVILIGGMAALYWGKTVQEATMPIEVVEEPASEPVEEELPFGNYLVFQVDETNFYRLPLSEATDRSQPSSAELVKFADVDQPLSVSGGLTTYIYGEHLLLHRYLEDDQDGILSLEGEVVETRPTQWGTIRSANGLYEIVWDSRYDGVRYDDMGFGMTVTDTQSGEVILETDETAFDFTSERWELEPFFIDNNGEYFYVRVSCASESCVSDFWQVEIATAEVTQLDEIIGINSSWSIASLDQETRRLLVINTERTPSTDGPGEELLPPTTIRLLDLDTLDSTELLMDEDRAWSSQRLDPQGKDRYVVRLWDEGNKLYLVNFDDTEITDEHYLTDGWVRDWVGDWLVVQNTQDLTLKLVNVESKEEVNLEIPGERVEYVGSITLD